MLTGFLGAIGIIIFLPAVLLLGVSFFVLFAVNKTDAKGLKNFGYVVAFLFWVTVAIVLLLGTLRVMMPRA